MLYGQILVGITNVTLSHPTNIHYNATPSGITSQQTARKRLRLPVPLQVPSVENHIRDRGQMSKVRPTFVSEALFLMTTPTLIIEW